jgi:hypothetical protein
MTAPLKLRACDQEDLVVLSSMIQDGLVPLSDMAYFAEDRRFVIALNRFRWDDPKSPTRTHALLTIQHVSQVQTRDLDRRKRDEIHNILSLTRDDGLLEIALSGGGTVRLDVETFDCLLEDVGEPWPAQAIPDHAADQ